MQYCVQLWLLYLIKNTAELGKVQMIRGLKHLSCEERLVREGERCLKGDMTMVYKIMHKMEKADTGSLFLSPTILHLGDIQ